jgi:small-conductance mechanosensitive channel
MIDRFVRVLGIVLLLQVGALLGGLTGYVHAQAAPADARTPKVEELLRLLNDPEVQAWIAKAPSAPAAATPEPDAHLADLEHSLRGHLIDLGAAARRLPSELAGAMDQLSAEGRGFGLVLITLAVVLAIGFAAERLVGRLLSERVSTVTLSVGDPVTVALGRLAPVLVFAATIVVLFMVSGGPPLFRRVVMTFLVAIIAIRVVAAIAGLIAALLHSTHAVLGGRRSTGPEAVPAQAVAAADGPVPPELAPTLAPVSLPVTTPIEDGAVGLWERRIVLFAAYFLMAWAALSSLRALGLSATNVQLLAYVAGIGLVVIAVEMVWRGQALDGRPRSAVKKWLLTLFLVLLWFAWSIGFTVAMWLGIYVLLLPRALSIAGQAATTVMERRAASGAAPSRIREVLIVRGVRALVVLAAVLWLGYVLRFSPGILAGNEMFGGQLARAVLRCVLILLVADLIWQLAKAYIDGTIAASDIAPDEVARRGRLRTLLPIMRIGLAVLVATVAGLMVLSELGVQVGPLIAGAGIFGVAIGFGSQTLVKDIISGMFYLMDDAFRVGEYIQSGSYKGTVEGFSLRSVRLRHHRGPVFTVPFGSLGAVQNMSRDWSIDKFLLRLPFDTDIKLVKKLSKQVGAQLLEDPDIAPNIIETVKMKGVEQIGDYGMDISFAMKTKPGNQTGVRRRAYALLRDNFAANGIQFARPSFNVAGDDQPASTAAALSEKTRIDQAKALEAAKA